MQHSPDRVGAGADIGEAFADPAFAALKARNAAFVVVRPELGEVIWANQAAAAHWGATDADRLTQALFGPGGRGGWLDGIARGAVPGRAPRLARAGLARGFGMRAHTALIRAWVAPDGTVLMGFAVPDSASRDSGDADEWRRPGWPVPVAAASTTTDPTAEPGTGQSLARRSQAAVLRDRLNHAFDGATSLRLLWRTDAAGIVTQIDADSFARLGAPLRFDHGTLPGLVAGFDAAAAARLHDALASRATWSGIALSLPVAGGAATVPMALSASPILGPDRVFAGFRGFGTLDLGRLELAPVPVRVPQDTGEEASPPLEPAPSADDISALPEAAPDESAAEEVAAVPVPQDVGPPQANVVHLRAFQVMASGRFAASPAPRLPLLPADETDITPAEEPAEPGEAPLSDDLAFQALGDALRARIGALSRAPEPVPEPVAETPAPAPPDPEPTSAADASSRLLDQLPLALLVMVAGAPAFANAAAAARLGYPASEALLAVGEELVASQDATTGAVVLRDADGAAATLDVRSTAVSWNDTPATLWILGEPEPVFSPPAAAPQAEKPECQAGDLLDRVDDAVALLDGSGLLRRLNRRGETWFGREGVLGQSFTQLLAPESRAAALTLLGDVRNQRDGLGAPPLNREIVARTGEAGPVPMLLTLGRLGASGFYATLRDVTALKRAETEQAHSDREHARDIDRLPGLLAKVSHDIRTPLSAILGFAEVMIDERFGPLGNPRYRDYLKDIHASGTQVVALVEDLLDLSRIEAGQLDLDVAAVDVNRIVAETVAQMQPEAHRERVIMRTSLGGRIPAVLADERSARQIVRNLLSNAVKFNEPGGQVIVSTALSDSGTVVLRVRDTGVGMTDDEIAAALEPFGGMASPHPANGNGSGNGLGLPLTRALVGANGASMAIRSRPREGTLVEIAFASAAATEETRLPA